MLTSVGLQIEVVLIHGGPATIDHRAGLGVPILCRVCGVRWKETRMMSLSADHDCELRVVRFPVCVEFAEGDFYKWHLVPENDRKLALGERNERGEAWTRCVILYLRNAVTIYKHP